MASQEHIESNRVGKIEMSRYLAKRFKISRALAADIFDAVAEHTIESMREGKSVSYPGLGTLQITETEARVGVRPGTRDRIEIKPGRKVTFRISTLLKAELRPKR